MAITSKYSNEKIEQILNEMIDVLDKHNANAELALMILGKRA